jgi:hypothetical protein
LLGRPGAAAWPSPDDYGPRSALGRRATPKARSKTPGLGARSRVEPLRVGGSGDVWWSEAIIHYADGSRWLAALIYEFSGDQIRRERAYFGQPFQGPAWRAQWVERGKPALG